jgi:hypothetical protein
LVEKSLDERFNSLEAYIKKLEHEIERLQAYVEIQNMMSRYEYLQVAGLGEGIAEMFARNTPDTRAEMVWGVFDGHEKAAVKLFGKGHTVEPERANGKLALHTLTTALIEVAKDGQTAKAIWISPGNETGALPGQKPEAHWAWCKYGIDFIKEDGAWKIWHFQVYGIFHCSFERSWAEEYTHAPMTNLSEERTPTRPPSYSWYYTPDRPVENIPEPPLPYETWDGKSMTTAEPLL